MKDLKGKEIKHGSHNCGDCNAGWNPHWLTCQRCGSVYPVPKPKEQKEEKR